MSGFVKFLSGGAATVLLALAAHFLLGTNTAYVDRLESRAKIALGNAGGGMVTLSMEREPDLRRVAILSGKPDGVSPDILLAAVKAVPGMDDARWAAAGSTASSAIDPALAPPATPAAGN